MRIAFIDTISPFPPTCNTVSGLYDFYCEADVVLAPQSRSTIEFTYAAVADKDEVVDVIICGELRKKGLYLTEYRHIITQAHSLSSPFMIEVFNSSDEEIILSAGDHVLHGIPVKIGQARVEIQ
jgi:dUTPase